MTAFDRALFRRTLLSLGVLSLFTAATVSMTDEATSTAGMRLGRLAALSPLITALALLGVGAHARARGELRALEAIGAPPWRALSGVERAGLVAAAASVILLVLRWTDTTSLFPAIHPVLDLRMSADGRTAFAPGIVVHATGAVELLGATTARASVALPHWAAVPCIAPVACLIPAWSVTPMRAAWRLLSSGATAVLVVASLHLVAAGRLSPSFGVVASIPVGLALLRARR